MLVVLLAHVHEGINQGLAKFTVSRRRAASGQRAALVYRGAAGAGRCAAVAGGAALCGDVCRGRCGGTAGKRRATPAARSVYCACALKDSAVQDLQVASLCAIRRFAVLHFAELPSLTECDAHDCTPKARELSVDLAWLSPATNFLRIAAGAAGAVGTSAAGTAARPAGAQQPGGTPDARLPAVVAVAVGELLRQTGELWGDSTLGALRQAAQTLSQLDAPVAAGQSEATVVRLAVWACSFAWPFLGLITLVKASHVNPVSFWQGRLVCCSTLQQCLG